MYETMLASYSCFVQMWRKLIKIASLIYENCSCQKKTMLKRYNCWKSAILNLCGQRPRIKLASFSACKRWFAPITKCMPCFQIWNPSLTYTKPCFVNLMKGELPWRPDVNLHTFGQCWPHACLYRFSRLWGPTQITWDIFQQAVSIYADMFQIYW